MLKQKHVHSLQERVEAILKNQKLEDEIQAIQEAPKTASKKHLDATQSSFNESYIETSKQSEIARDKDVSQHANFKEKCSTML